MLPGTSSLGGMTYSPVKGKLEVLPWGQAGRTVQIGVLDVDGLGGLVIGGAVWVVGRGHEHLQHPFPEAWLEHHAPAPHAQVLATRVQVVDAHRDCRPERTQVSPCPGQQVLLSLPAVLCPHRTLASGCKCAGQQ